LLSLGFWECEENNERLERGSRSAYIRSIVDFVVVIDQFDDQINGGLRSQQTKGTSIIDE
jgi:hypothetical protein